jgi:hypothetical protein
MQQQSFYQILESSSFIVSGDSKSGKMTFVLYMLSSLFKEKALIFTPQESHLFKRRINALKTLYTQFSNIDELIKPYFIKNDWKTLKQRYGFDFFIQELQSIIRNSQEKVVIVHRFGEFFEFQDRYEIEHVYKSLVSTCESEGKKLIIIANSSDENFSQISKISDEFSDIGIKIELGEDAQRLIFLRDMLRNKEYPKLEFQARDDSFLLDYYHKEEIKTDEIVKNVLICELDYIHDNLVDICKYIFDKPGFTIKYATSMHTILKEVFISPDIIIVLMKRTQENFETIKSIKMHLPNAPVIAIIDQEFVRAEDEQIAYTYGIDELFASNLNLDKLILSCQKASKDLFYFNALKELPKYSNTMSNLKEMITLAKECKKRSIFFSAFVFKVDKNAKKVSPSRENDYVFQDEKKLYYLALNTAPKDVYKIMEKFKGYELMCLWEPINHDAIEDCLK